LDVEFVGAGEDFDPDLTRSELDFFTLSIRVDCSARLRSLFPGSIEGFAIDEESSFTVLMTS
jgi:hypothetical protein